MSVVLVDGVVDFRSEGCHCFKACSSLLSVFVMVYYYVLGHTAGVTP